VPFASVGGQGYVKVAEAKEERERERGRTGERPVKASNGQYWRAKKASIVVSSCCVAVRYITSRETLTQC
jgi:hypothetical protein